MERATNGRSDDDPPTRMGEDTYYELDIPHNIRNEVDLSLSYTLSAAATYLADDVG